MAFVIQTAPDKAEGDSRTGPGVLGSPDNAAGGHLGVRTRGR